MSKAKTNKYTHHTTFKKNTGSHVNESLACWEKHKKWNTVFQSIKADSMQ